MHDWAARDRGCGVSCRCHRPRRRRACRRRRSCDPDCRDRRCIPRRSRACRTSAAHATEPAATLRPTRIVARCSAGRESGHSARRSRRPGRSPDEFARLPSGRIMSGGVRAMTIGTVDFFIIAVDVAQQVVFVGCAMKGTLCRMGGKASVSKRHDWVAGPASPSSTSQFVFWKALTAVFVSGPKRPSGTRGGLGFCRRLRPPAASSPQVPPHRASGSPPSPPPRHAGSAAEPMTRRLASMSRALRHPNGGQPHAAAIWARISPRRVSSSVRAPSRSTCQKVQPLQLGSPAPARRSCGSSPPPGRAAACRRRG